MATARDQINGALRLLGVLASGETADADEERDGLTALNQMIDSWNTERLSVFSTQDQVFTWPAGQTLRTLGPTGNFVGNRPVLMQDSAYFRDSSTGISYGIRLINQKQYNDIALKTSTSDYPQAMVVNMTMPDIELTVYPQPTRNLEFHFISVEELSQPANLSTVLSFPPGYLRAFRYNLACELAPEWGVEPSPQVSRIAMISKRNLKRINNPNDIMSIPGAIGFNRSRFNVFTGSF